jgi:hypothetical protein
MKMPTGFLNDKILPYVALFNQGDRVEIIGAKIIHLSDGK